MVDIGITGNNLYNIARSETADLGSSATDINSAAVPTGGRRYVYHLVLAETSGAAATVTITDGTNTILKVRLTANQTVELGGNILTPILILESAEQLKGLSATTSTATAAYYDNPSR